ncbi:hypothetical protein JHK85_031876 [Glycine max]|nr:hypothetical protein JHK85_031876 [Glycine max]
MAAESDPVKNRIELAPTLTDKNRVTGFGFSPITQNGGGEIGAPGTPDFFRVTSLALPNSQLLGSISEDLGLIQYLRHIDLSNNFLNGYLPNTIFNSSELHVLSLSNNVISGELPQLIGKMTNLKLLNLSDNAFGGLIPESNS